MYSTETVVGFGQAVRAVRWRAEKVYMDESLNAR
jgi:hypothetical protein